MEQKQKRKFINSRPLFYAFLCLFFAICTARYVFQGNVTYLVLDGVALLALIVGCGVCRSWKILAILLSIFAFGLLWFFFGCASFLGQTYSGTVSVTGRISDDVSYDKYGKSVTVVLKDVKVNGKSESNILLAITLDGSWEQEIGDKIAFETELESVSLFTLGSFNSSCYRDRTPYTATVESDAVTVTGNRRTLAESFRLSVKSVLNENMSTEHASTAYAVLFGDKNDLDSSVEDVYQQAGVVHLLSVSGLHISFLIALFGWLLKICHVKGWASVIACGIFAFVYAYLCGFTPSILRAGIMGVLLFSTALSGKKYDSLSSVGGAGLIIMILSPLSALDLGFQLSFFCVIAIILICPWLSAVLKKVFPSGIASAFALTLSASLGIAPFVASMGTTVNLLGFFTNLVVLPLFSVLYPLLLVSVILVLCMPFLSFLLKGCEFGFEAIFQINRFMKKTDLKMTYDQLTVFAYAFFYLGLFSMSKLVVMRKDAKALLCTVLFSLCAAFEIVPSTIGTAEEGLAYFNYYTDSMVVLTNSDKETILIDTADESFTSRALRRLQVSNVRVLLILQNAGIDKDAAEAAGVEIVVRADRIEGYDNEQLVECNVYKQVFGFIFEYISYNNTLLGLEVRYDDMCVLIAKAENLTDENVLVLNSSYDIVVLGEKSEYASYFSGKVLTYYSTDNSFTSYQEDGNVIVTNDLKRRCLD